MNAIGKVVYSEQVTNEARIDLKDAKSGLYFIRIQNEEFIKVKRLIISK